MDLKVINYNFNSNKLSKQIPPPATGIDALVPDADMDVRLHPAWLGG